MALRIPDGTIPKPEPVYVNDFLEENTIVTEVPDWLRIKKTLGRSKQIFQVENLQDGAGEENQIFENPFAGEESQINPLTEE